MKPDKHPGSQPAETGNPPPAPDGGSCGVACPCTATTGYAVAFGLFLALALVKWGAPVVLNEVVGSPRNAAEFWGYNWPSSWAGWLLAPLAIAGAYLAITCRPHPRVNRWLWVLPLAWFAWQIASATQTIDAQLTTGVVWHFSGILVCYFAGLYVLGKPAARNWVLIGLLTAFAYCLVRAANQKMIEFPQELQMLMEGERQGWTNFPPETLSEMKQNNVIIRTNDMDLVNPAFLAKYQKGRVFGTLAGYPNALAGLILLLGPVSLMLAFSRTRPLRPAIRAIAIGLTLFLVVAGMYWTGSKLGWLVALALIGVGLLRMRWPTRWKYLLIAIVLVGGLSAFAVRFQKYFASGATSVGARFEYWRVAGRTALDHPWFGSGPGTFQRPYAELKAPEAEMARLTHNDYLEQFSDSGFPAGLLYLAWIVFATARTGRRVWLKGGVIEFGIWLGLLGWFLQGLGEFGLYIPALAWTAFALMGWLAADAGCCVAAGILPAPATAGPGL